VGVTELMRTMRHLSTVEIKTAVWRLWVPYLALAGTMLALAVWNAAQSNSLDEHVEDAHHHICTMTADENRKARALALAGDIDPGTVDEIVPALECRGEVLYFADTGDVFVDLGDEP
jgi:hypothetical protein